MKHTLKATLLVLIVFLITQLIGLNVVNNYINHEELQKTGNIVFQSLPLNFERPELEEKTSFFYIIIAILIGTAIALVLIKYQIFSLWKIWFLLAVFITLSVAFKSFMPEIIAVTLAGLLALWKIYRPNFYIHNITELFIYGGLAAIFVPILNVFSIVMLLFLISAYDMYAVWKSKHMIKLAKFQTKAKLFAGVIIPYKLPSLKQTGNKVKVKTAILGGGDIGFPLLFAGVVLKELLLTNTVAIAMTKVLIIPAFTTLALGWLLYKAEKDKFYPAMPIISLGCFLGYIVMHLLNFL